MCVNGDWVVKVDFRRAAAAQAFVVRVKLQHGHRTGREVAGGREEAVKIRREKRGLEGVRTAVLRGP